MPASSHYKAKGRPTVRKAVTALKRAIARRGKGIRRGRRGGSGWNLIADAWKSIPSALGNLPPSPSGISHAGAEQWLRSLGIFG
jgi:hypothetical protein